MTKQVTLDPEAEEEQMGILQHLDVLRIHLTRAFIGLVIGAAISFAFAAEVFKFLVSCQYFSTLFISEEDIAASCPNIQFIRPTENIEVYFSIVLLCGVIITMPWILYQFWAFISPGLLPTEKRLVFIFIPIATLLFLTGVAFAWFVLIPPALNFLNNFLATETTRVEWTADSYFDFITGFLFWLGTAFQLPLIFYFLGRFG
ncbi:MAG: twin-arginine translocase subunit TatC, partial [Candidatus Promineifilaceae bacterium]